MKYLVKVALRYGILAGILGSGIVIALYYMGRHPFLFPVYADFRIILFGIFLFFTLREIRDYYQNGVLYFAQGILASALFTATYAVVSSGLIYAFGSIVPAFVQEYISLSLEQLRSLPSDVVEKIGKDVYEKNLKMLPSTGAGDLALLYFSQSFLISLFLSIILSVILRRQPKT